MNTKLRTEANNDFEKDFFKLMKKAQSNKKKSSEPNYHTANHFSEKLFFRY